MVQVAPGCAAGGGSQGPCTSGSDTVDGLRWPGL